MFTAALPLRDMISMTHRKISRPKSAASAAAVHARANHAVTSALGTVKGKVFILPAHAASETALTELQLDVFDVERVR